MTPQEISDKYNLTEITHNGKVYIDTQKVMYGIPQAGIIEHDILKQYLEKHGYKHVKLIPRL